MGYNPCMESSWLNRAVKFYLALCICAVAMLLPYRLRLLYTSFLSFWIHLPYRIFGRLARFLLDRLNIEPVAEP